MDPYLEAEKINQKIIEVVQREEITEENAREWILFCRTIMSSLNIINTCAEKTVYNLTGTIENSTKLRNKYLNKKLTNL